MKMTIKLNAAGMTSLHKAGLAGLYLTLMAFQEKKEKIKGLKWKLEPTQIALDWPEESLKETFKDLIEQSFWIDQNGFIVLKGLEIYKPLTTAQKNLLYTALLNSFLQFGPHRPTGEKRSLTYEEDEHTCWIKDFAPIKKFRHQKASEDFIDKSGKFKTSIETAGWLYPGGSQRHVAYKKTKINESLESGLALLFAPVGVVYYLINSRVKRRKSRLAMLVPEIKNLETYFKIRQILAQQGVLNFTASSASDAALRMITSIEMNRTSNQATKISGGLFTCKTITFGIVDWNEKQKTRTYTRTVSSGHLKGLENYFRAMAIFKNRWQKVTAKYDRNGKQTEPERFFATTFSAREFIADNVAQGNVWYHNITSFLCNKDIFAQLLYERKEISQMVEKAIYDDENESLFINVCHESWRRRLGKLGQRAITENTNFHSLVKKETEKLRTSLARCKNAETLRETVVDFWSRAGSNEMLRNNGLAIVLPLFGERNWKKARDLALLALISYQPQSQEEEEALTITNDNGEN